MVIRQTVAGIEAKYRITGNPTSLAAGKHFQLQPALLYQLIWPNGQRITAKTESATDSPPRTCVSRQA